MKLKLQCKVCSVNIWARGYTAAPAVKARMTRLIERVEMETAEHVYEAVRKGSADTKAQALEIIYEEFIDGK